jgi:hypothetical protein
VRHGRDFNRATLQSLRNRFDRHRPGTRTGTKDGKTAALKRAALTGQKQFVSHHHEANAATFSIIS